MLKTDKPLQQDDATASGGPKAILSRLAALEARFIAAVYLLGSPNGAATEPAFAAFLARLLGDEEQARAALDSAAAQGWLSRQENRIAVTEAGRAAFAATCGAARPPDSEAAAEKILLALALGLDPANKTAMRTLGRQGNLETAALAKLFLPEAPEPLMSRSLFRFAFHKNLLIERFPEYAAQLGAASPRNYRANSLVNALVLGLAGKSGSSIEEAEREMLHDALGLKRGSKITLASAIIRAAASPKPKEARAAQPKQSVLAEFSALVRRIARTMETPPHKGRVAIAQVYDAGLAQGLDFGSLDEFKARIAEACRSGLLDLERYDIAGPLDPILRDRSRTPFGRDERHFIVNQWI